MTRVAARSLRAGRVAQAASANSSGVASRPASGAIRSSTATAVERRLLGGRPADDLARERIELVERLRHALAEAGVVEAIGEAAVQLGEPRQARLVEHLRRVAPLAELAPRAQEALHLDVQPLRMGERLLHPPIAVRSVRRRWKNSWHITPQ